ncbi:MAG: hypothetical protein ABIO67_00590 [Mycobacteriales bacterium]
MPYRRYAPAWLLAAALLLLVAIAPSKGIPRGSAAEFAPFNPGSTSAGPLGTGGVGGAPGAPGTVGPGGTQAGGSAGGSGPTAGGSTGGSGTRGTGGGGSTGSVGGPGGAAGDTAHCVGGKQFALAGFNATPPCQPAFAGGSNGGATYKGVTADTVEVVYYQVKPNPAVQAAFGSAGVIPTDAQLADYLKAVTVFINKRYELWGRKIRIDVYQSPSCQGSPPSDDCFRQDARAVIAKHSPFIVLFPQNGTTPGFQDELSKAGVINFGGLGLPSDFNTSRRPFRYDYTMDGDTQVAFAAEQYCKRLANNKAVFAGDATLRGTVRKAEILVPDSEQTVATAQRLQAKINACDKNGAVIKSYSQDTSQAASQSTTLASQAKQSGITTFLWLTDPVTPIFLTPQMTSQNYFPENVILGANYLDFDPLAQLYDGRQWANAFGLGNLAESQALKTKDGYAAYRDGGGTADLYVSADGAQSYLSIVAAGLQQAGARLDPGTFERGMLTLPAYGGDRSHTLVKFGAGDYTGQSDVRTTYWDANATSPENGKRGAYKPLDGGRRFGLGALPSTRYALPGR